MKPALDRIPQTTYSLQGPLAHYLKGVGDQWLKIAPAANPAMLEMFRDRDRLPRRNMVPWAGEFAGKYLTSAVQILRLTDDPDLKNYIKNFVDKMVRSQAEDGYLGPWPRTSRIANKAPNVGIGGGLTWDTWGHYHAMLGLLLWHEDTRDKKALNCAIGIADLICKKYLGKKRRRLVDSGSTEMNLAVVHSLCLLYHKTKTPSHLEMAQQIVTEFAAEDERGPLAGDYLRTALAGDEFFKIPKPRWESLHPIQGLVELYWLTGEESYRQAFEHIWWSIVKLDRHNNGGFSSGEKAQGNPYHKGAIETCCTVAWIAFSIDMLRLTGNSVVADEIELSTLNSGLGLHSHTGRWVTYNTPMDGVRKASAHDIVFQAREGTPELNCCSVNGPRALGTVSEWALMRCPQGLALNWYGPGTLKTRLSPGIDLELEQSTEYPRRGRIEIKVTPSEPSRFVLKLRIPYWSARTRVALNSRPVKGISPGTYLELERQWQRGDKIVLELDFSLHFWVGEKQSRGKTSIFRGPVLLTYDRRLNSMDPAVLPALDAGAMKGRLLANVDELPTVVVMEYTAPDGRKLKLCDFASAGAAGSPYISWLKVGGVEKAPFGPLNPLRSSRP